MKLRYRDGTSTFTQVPDGVQAVNFVASGGSGGASTGGTPGGLAGIVQGTFYVTPGQQLISDIGGAGAPGLAGGYGVGSGGAPGASLALGDDAGGGGGATAITAGDNAMVVAGGGGGAGGYGLFEGRSTRGGAGGSGSQTGSSGSSGQSDPKNNGGAGGGTQQSSRYDGLPGAAAIDTGSGGNSGTNGAGGGGGAGTPVGAGGSVGPATVFSAGGGGGGGGGSAVNNAVFDALMGTTQTASDGEVTLSWDTAVAIKLAPLGQPAASSAPVPLTISAVNTDTGEQLPSPTGFLHFTSSEPTDSFTNGGVVMTNAGDRTITASWINDPAVTSSIDITVVPGPLTGLAIVDTPSTATAGSTVPVEVEGVDSFGNLRGDATSVATFASNVASDSFSTQNPNEVTMSQLGPHVITVSYPRLTSASITVTVVAAQSVRDVPPKTRPHRRMAASVPRRPGAGPVTVPQATSARLAATGTSGIGSMSVLGTALLALGSGLTFAARRRGRAT